MADRQELFEGDADAVEQDALARARQLATLRMTLAARAASPPVDLSCVEAPGAAPPATALPADEEGRPSNRTTASAYVAHKAALAAMRRKGKAGDGKGPRRRRGSVGSTASAGSLDGSQTGTSPARGPASATAGRSSADGQPASPPRPPVMLRAASAPSPTYASAGGAGGTEDTDAARLDLFRLDALPFMQGTRGATPLFTPGAGTGIRVSLTPNPASDADARRLAAATARATGTGFSSMPDATPSPGGSPSAFAGTGAAPGSGTESPSAQVGRSAALSRAPGEGAVAAAAAAAATAAVAPGGGVQFEGVEGASLASEGEDDDDAGWLPVELEGAFQRVVITGHEYYSEESRKVCRELMEVLKLRTKHHYVAPEPYWGAWHPCEFEAVEGGGGTDTPAAPPGFSREPTYVDEQGTILGLIGHGTLRPTSSTMEASSTCSTVELGSQGTPLAPSGMPPPIRVPGEGSSPGGAASEAEAGGDPRLFYRRRPELPFKVFGRKEIPPPPAVRFAYVAVDGIITAHHVGTPAPSVRPSAAEQAGTGGVGLDYTISPKHVCSAAEAEALGVPPDSRIFGTMPLPGEVLAPAHFQPPSFEEFQADYFRVVRLIHWAPAKTFCYRRLQLLQSRFQLHKILNSPLEVEESKGVPHRDFYNVRKVDTHVHHSACMTQKHLLRFIKHKLKKHPNEVVKERDGQPVTLAQVFRELNLTAYDLSIDTLDMHADDTFHRFDRFNLKYSPIGQSLLREVFLKTDNFLGGRYLAEITRQVFDDLESSKYQLAEYRLSVYGRRPSEWGKLARWVTRHNLASRNVRWMIQIPRLYEIYKAQGLVQSFQDMIDNLFLPLWEVSVNPEVDLPLHHFLTLVVGIDMVDDESKQESARDAKVPPPHQWTFKHAPPYYYWVYYINANIQSLNHFRASRGLSTFAFRPHAGEAGEVDHLAATLLTAEGVNHGITMRKNPTLQYLYYLSQIGLAMSPLSNNKLFLEYNSNPFFAYFQRGLNVSLSTDDPALFHYTREPLVEEYCVAAQVWKMNSVDMCEIARNSVLQSGFEHPWKRYWLGEDYAIPGPRGSDIHLTNVPNIRLQFRFETLMNEHGVVQEGSGILTSLPVEVTPFPPTPQALTQDAKDQAQGRPKSAPAAGAPAPILPLSPALPAMAAHGTKA